MSGAVFEWYASNARIAYPFRDDVLDPITGLFVDLYVMSTLPTIVAGDPLEWKLYSVDLDAGSIRFDRSDDTLIVQLGPTDSFQQSVIGDYTVYSWRQTEFDGDDLVQSDTAVMLVAITAKITDYSYPYLPSGALIDTSLINKRVGRVRQMAVALPGQGCCDTILGEKVQFESGNNMDITEALNQISAGLDIVTPDVVRRPRTINFAAIPGAGVGKFIDCDSSTSDIKLINAVGPAPNGNIELSGEDCTWYERRVQSTAAPIHPNTDYLATVYASLLQLHQDCGACCDCTDFKNAYETLAAVWARALAVSKRVETLRRQYNALVERIKTIKTTVETGLNVQVQTVARPDFHLAVSVIAYNNSNNTYEPAIEITFDKTGWVYTPASAILDTEYLHKQQIDPANDGTTLRIDLPLIRPTAYIQYTLEVRFTPAGDPRVGAIVHTTGRVLATGQDASMTATSVLQGPLVKT